jgi:hypothetical protein
MSLQGGLGIERMCMLAGASRAGFYCYLRQQDPWDEEMEVRSEIQKIALEHQGRYEGNRPSPTTAWSGSPLRPRSAVRLLGIHAGTPRASDDTEYEQPTNPYDNATCESFLRTLKQYTVQNIKPENSGSMDSFACGGCGGSLFDCWRNL